MSESKFAGNRRVFMMQAVVGAGAVFALNSASAQSAVVESDPQAVALGYKSDATKVDKTKQPKYAAGQMCGACALYQGKAGAATGPCPLFGGKLVSSKGWCSAYVKKA